MGRDKIFILLHKMMILESTKLSSSSPNPLRKIRIKCSLSRGKERDEEKKSVGNIHIHTRLEM